MSSINIPDDVLMEILARLPVKCLIKFKCVCKSWSALVANRSFIAKHHQTQAALNDNGCILIKRGLDNSQFDNFSLLYSKGSAVSCVDLVLPFIVKRETLQFVRLIGPCNGLFCVTFEQSYDITIWNPATREFTLLPRSPHSLLEYSPWASIGFGFDSITNDYKVVRIYLTLGVGKKFICKVEVWNLSDNSWRKINAIPPVLLSQPAIYHVYRNGIFYWDDFLNDPEIILSFDMGNEVFKEIKLPDYRCVRVGQGLRNHRYEMFELNGSIAVSSYPVDGDERGFEIWRMNEFGEHISWSKYLTVEIPIGLSGRPYGFWKNNEIILDDGNRMIISYDPLTKRTRNLGFFGRNFHQVLIYNESLVSIK